MRRLPRWPLFLLPLCVLCLPLGLRADEDDEPSSDPDARIRARTEQFQRDIEDLRGLKFKNPVEIGIQNRDELREKMMEEFDKEMSDEKSESMKKVMVKFGLLPKDLELKKFMIDLMTEQIAGFYDPEEKSLFLIRGSEKKETSDDPNDAMMAQLGASQDDIVAVHELTHALQDQNWDLLTMPLEGVQNDDLITAQKALVEGEATYVMYDWLLQQRGMSLDMLPEGIMEQAMGGSGGGMPGMEQMEKAPKIIRESLIFPYMGGLKYIMKTRKSGGGSKTRVAGEPEPEAEGGWAAIDQIYADLPASTEQILHPEKYAPGNRDYPQAVALPDVAKLCGDDWKVLDRNVMGELSTDVMFQEIMNVKGSKTRKASGGWDGDQYVCFENGKTKEVALVWFTTWDSEEDAREFGTAMRKALQKKYEVETPDVEEELKKVWKSTPGGPVLLERRGMDVLIVESVPGEKLDDVVASVWKDTTRAEVKRIERIEPKERPKEAGKPKPEGKKAAQKKVDPSRFEIQGEGFALSLAKPGADWTMKGSGRRFDLESPSSAAVLVRVTVSDRDGGELGAAVAAAKGKYKDEMKGFSVVNEIDCALGGCTAHDSLYSGTPAGFDAPLRVRVCVLEAPKHFITITGTALESDYEANAPLFEKMIRSVEMGK